MHHRRHLVEASLLTAVMLVEIPGCYTVTLSSIPAVPNETIPIRAQIEIPPETAAFTYEVRSAAAGIGNSWTIEVGAALTQYANAYLETPLSNGVPAVVNITIESFDVHDFEAHADVRFAVKMADRIPFSQVYHGKGVGYFSQTVWGGAFAMKSSMRKTTNEALRSVFNQFMSDARAQHGSWVQEATREKVE